MNTIITKMILPKNCFIKIINKINKNRLCLSASIYHQDKYLFCFIFNNTATFSEIKEWGMSRIKNINI